VANQHIANLPGTAHLVSMSDATVHELVALEVLQPRPLWRAMARGFICRCPQCGKGQLFRRFLKPVANCAVCGEDYTAQRADDAPPYFTMIIVGHILVPIMLVVELTTVMPVLTQMLIWIPLTGILTISLLQPVKGAIIALQWALRMHGFDPNAEESTTGSG
jgi:uncharacterized protein (DUF983 family)